MATEKEDEFLSCSFMHRTAPMKELYNLAPSCLVHGTVAFIYYTGQWFPYTPTNFVIFVTFFFLLG
jgi:hypothetical protein